MGGRTALARQAARWVEQRVGDGTITRDSGRNQLCSLRRLIEVHGTRPVGDVDESTWHAWLARLTSEVKRSTAANQERVGRAFVRWLVDEGLVARVPWRGKARPKPPAVPRGLSEAQVDGLEAVAADDPRTALVIELGLHGLRRAEIAGQRWDNEIDGVLTFPGKGGRERSVPLTARGVAAWERWKACDAGWERWPNATAAARRAGYVFPSPRGGHVDPDTVGGWVSEALYAAGVKHRPRDLVSTHALRHTCGNRLTHKVGAPLPLVQDVLGHASLQSTQVYTGRSSMKARREALTKALSE